MATLKVQDQSDAVVSMAANWPIAEALLAETPGMRAAGQALLPKWPNEETKSYEARLATATLLPAFSRTIGVMSGKPFSKALTLGEDVPANIRTWCEDIDQQGTNLHTFASQLMQEALAFGINGVLVDFPVVNPDAVKTLDAERKIGARPYCVLIKHNQVLGWKAERINGVMQLTQLRIAESKEVPDGEFGVKYEPRVRVLEPGTWRVYKPGAEAKDDWTLESGGITTLDVVPYVPFYGKKTGFMTGVSPLLGVAYLNVKHWQSQSDQDTILHVARVPILAVIGAEDGIGENGQPTPWTMTVGSSAAVRLPKDGDMKYVEHGGKAIEAGEKALEKLEAQMVQTGAELLVEKPGEQKSATQSNNDAEGNKSDLQRIVESHEDSLDQVLQLMAKWVREPNGGHVSLFKDFGAANLTDASAQLIVSLQQAGLITKVTAIKEQQRRGMLSPDIKPEDELTAVSEEGPSLGTLGTGGNGG